MLEGYNMPDYGRFAVGAYLLRAGWSIGEVTEVYRATPNFDERITVNRLEQLQNNLENLSIPGRRAIMERLKGLVPGLEEP
jgi:hypothetical protein